MRRSSTRHPPIVAPVQALAAAALALASACAGGLPSQGLVIVDEAARSSGVVVVANGRALAQVGAVELPNSGDVTVVGRDREQIVHVEPGQVLWIQGAESRARTMEIGRDIRDDELEVVGTESGAHSLARALNGTVEGTRDGRWIVRAPHAFTALPHLAGLEGITDVLPALATPRTDNAEPIGGSSATQPTPQPATPGSAWFGNTPSAGSSGIAASPVAPSVATGSSSAGASPFSWSGGSSYGYRRPSYWGRSRYSFDFDADDSAGTGDSGGFRVRVVNAPRETPRGFTCGGGNRSRGTRDCSVLRAPGTRGGLQRTNGVRGAREVIVRPVAPVRFVH